MSTPIAIPSHGRAHEVNGLTLRALADGGVAADDVHLFVEPGQLPEYRRQVDPTLCAHVLPGALGLGAQRRAIAAHFGQGARVVHVDDDMRALVRRVNDKKLAPIADLPSELADAWHYAEAAGARLWGVYPTANAGWMKPRVRTGLSFICGGWFGEQIDLALQPSVDQKEDYERTLLYWDADGTVARVEWLGFRTTMYRPGGMQAEGQPDRVAANERTCEYLMGRWPAQVRRATRVGRCGTELRLYEYQPRTRS